MRAPKLKMDSAYPLRDDLRMVSFHDVYARIVIPLAFPWGMYFQLLRVAPFVRDTIII